MPSIASAAPSMGLSFDGPAAVLLLKLACVLLGLWLCLQGGRALSAFFTGLVGVGCGYGGVLLCKHFPDMPALELVFFTMFAFFGLCAGFFLITLLACPLKRLSFSGWIPEFLPVLPGAALCAWTAGVGFLSRLWLAGCLFAALSLWGILRQQNRRRHPKIHHTYDDLYRMPRPEESHD